MENVDNLILEHLRAIRSDVGVIKEDVRELKSRVTSLEHGQATLLQQMGHLGAMLATQQASHDRLVDRVERLEHRSDLTDAPSE